MINLEVAISSDISEDSDISEADITEGGVPTGHEYVIKSRPYRLRFVVLQFTINHK